jgi:protein SCO1/2
MTSVRGAAKPKPMPTDVTVQTADGRTLRFYSDLVRGRVVAVNFIFTSCTTVCPLMGARFAQLQRLLEKGSPAGEVSLISVSIDPATDTPARLAAWAARMGGRPGWTLVTGAKPDIDTLTRSLGAPASDPASHAPLIVVIDDRNGRWLRLDGLTDPAKLARILRDVVASKAP